METARLWRFFVFKNQREKQKNSEISEFLERRTGIEPATISLEG